MKQATRLGGRQKPSFLEVGFCRGVENQNVGPHRLLPLAALCRAVLNNDLEFIQPSGGVDRRPLLSGQGRKSQAICRGAKHAFRSNLGSPTAHSRSMPVVRTESTPQARHEQKKRAHLSRLRNEGRKRRKLLPACRSLPGYPVKKSCGTNSVSYKSVWYKVLHVER